MKHTKNVSILIFLCKIAVTIIFIFLPLISFLYGIQYEKTLHKNSTQRITTIPQQPSLTPAENTSNVNKWKSFTNDTFVKFTIDYPSNWQTDTYKGPSYFMLIMISPDEKRITLKCPRGEGTARTDLPNPSEWEPNEGGYVAQYLKKFQINGMETVEYVWGNPNQKSNTSTLNTAIQRKNNPIVCEFSTDFVNTKNSIEDTVKMMDTYNQITHSLRYVD